MSLRWPIRLLLCACAIAPVAVRAQTNPAAQPAQVAPAAVPAEGAAPVAPPSTPETTAMPPAAPKPGDAAAQPAQPASSPTAQPSGEDSGTQAPPTTAPAPSGPEASAAATSQPPVPAAEGATAEAEQADSKKPTVPWSASLIWRQGYVVAGLNPSAYQTYNPTYTWTFLALLGYRFDEKTSLDLFQPATVELTDSASTNTRQELWFLDTIIDLSHTFYEVEPVKDDQTLKLSAGVGVSLPLSKASQAESMIFAPRLRLGGGYEFKHVLEGLSLGADAYYSRRLLSSNTIAAAGPYSCATVNETLSHPCTRLDSFPSTRDEVLMIASGSLGLTSKLRFGAQLWFYWDRAADLGTATFTDPSGGTKPLKIEDNSTTHWHNSRLFTFSLAYSFTDWFTGAARVTNTFGERGPAGELRAPFNPLDTSVGIDLAVSFDKLYMSTRGHGGS